MADQPHEGAQAYLPQRPTIPSMRKAVQDCRGCDLHENATQAVFGAGSRDPELVVVGEQPGDVEDQQGKPFVGPAGRLLDRALERAGIDPEVVYRTNAVKHFRFKGTKGKRRLHATPSQWQVAACQPWLLAELEALQPTGVVVLGATAGRSLLGASFRVNAMRGRLLETDDLDVEWVVATTHPSAVLRAPDRDEAMDDLVADLSVVADALGS